MKIKYKSQVTLKPIISWVCPFCSTWFSQRRFLISHIKENDYVMPPIKFKTLKPK